MNFSIKILCAVVLFGTAAAATVSLAGPDGSLGKDTFICCWTEK